MRHSNTQAQIFKPALAKPVQFLPKTGAVEEPRLEVRFVEIQFMATPTSTGLCRLIPVCPRKPVLPSEEPLLGQPWWDRSCPLTGRVSSPTPPHTKEMRRPGRQSCVCSQVDRICSLRWVPCLAGGTCVCGDEFALALYLCAPSSPPTHGPSVRAQRRG